MVDPITTEVASLATESAGVGIGGTLLLFLRIVFWAWIVVVFLLQAIIAGIQAKNIGVTFVALGNRFGLVTQQLNDKSVAIIQHGLAANGFWSAFLSLSDFIILFIVIWLWLKILSTIISWIPNRINNNKAYNYLWAFIIFTIIQIFASLVAAGIGGSIHSYVGANDSALYFITQPFVCYWHFLQAVYTIFAPWIMKVRT